MPVSKASCNPSPADREPRGTECARARAGPPPHGSLDRVATGELGVARPPAPRHYTRVPDPSRCRGKGVSFVRLAGPGVRIDITQPTMGLD